MLKSACLRHPEANHRRQRVPLHREDRHLVCVPLPDFVLTALEAVPKTGEKHFFWAVESKIDSLNARSFHTCIVHAKILIKGMINAWVKLESPDHQDDVKALRWGVFVSGDLARGRLLGGRR